MPVTTRAEARPAVADARIPAGWLTLLGTPLAFGMTAPTLLIPRAAADLGVSEPSASWLLTAFGAGIALGTPLLSRLVSRNGARFALLLSAALMAAGTLLLALVPLWSTLALAVLGRVLQGVGGAGLTAIAMSLAGTPRRMGLITSGIAAFGAVGPLASSALADVATWHVALLITAVNLIAVPAVASRTTTVAPPGTPFDVPGALLVAALVTAAVFLPQAPVLSGAALVATAALLVCWIRVRPEGFVPAEVVTRPGFLLFSGLALVLSTGYFTLFFGMPALLDDRAGWGDSQVGTGQLVAQLVGSGLALALTSVAGRMVPRVVVGVLVALGAVAAVTGLVAAGAILTLAACATALLAAASAQGLLSLYATNDLPERQRPTGIGLFNACYQLGSALSPALVAQLL